MKAASRDVHSDGTIGQPQWTVNCYNVTINTQPDTTYPVIHSFAAEDNDSTPLSGTGPFTLTWTAPDNEGLQQAEPWYSPTACTDATPLTWKSLAILPVASVFSHTPEVMGLNCYGLHITDNNFNCTTEAATSCGGSTIPYGQPIPGADVVGPIEITKTALSQPDLTPSSFTPPSTMCLSQGYSVIATVKNAGSATSNGFITVDYVDNTHDPGNCSKSDSAVIDAGSTYQNYTCTYTPYSLAQLILTATVSGGAETNTGNNSLGAQVTVIDKPGAPTNLRGTAVTDTSITWDWDTITEADCYDVYLDSQTNYYMTWCSNNPITVTGLACNTSHTLWVASYAACGTSAKVSDQATTSACPLPDLVAQGLTLAPVSPTAGNAVTFTGTIINQSGTNASSVDAQFCVDSASGVDSCYYNQGGILGAPFPTDQFTPGEAQPWSSEPWIASAGTHTVYLCADLDDTVLETDDTSASNCTSSAFTVTNVP